MFSIKQWIAVPVAMAIGILGLSSSAKANDLWQHIDEVSCEMREDAAVLNATVQTHLQGCGYITQLKQCIAVMDRLACHIHDNVGGRHCPFSLQSDVRQLKSIHHNTEALFQALAAAGRINPHVYQVVACQMGKLEQSICHLQEDLDNLRRNPLPTPFPGNFPGQGFPGQGQLPNQGFPNQGQFPGQGFPQSVPSYPGLGQPAQPFPTQPGLSQPLQQPSLYQRSSYRYPQQGYNQPQQSRGLTVGNDRFQITFGGRR